MLDTMQGSGFWVQGSGPEPVSLVLRLILIFLETLLFTILAPYKNLALTDSACLVNPSIITIFSKGSFAFSNAFFE